MGSNANGKTKGDSRYFSSGFSRSALIYVTDNTEGIKRIRRGKSFTYYLHNKKLTAAGQLTRIKQLAIPPAWEKVWICSKANGHLQATGYDTKNRKQYLYHPLWIALRGKTKFFRLHAFGKALPAIRKQVCKDLRLKGLPKQKVLAAAVCLLEQTHIRIGNTLYEKRYGSYGLSTFKDQNVQLTGDKIRFVFKGKKGIHHDISIKDRRLAKIVQHCREIPGKHLFQYYDEEENRQPVWSEDINNYIKQLSGKDFTSKDFRTWSGTLECLRAFLNPKEAAGIQPTKKELIAAIDHVANCLGNTRSVCKKYYIHPTVLSAYEKGQLSDYLDRGIRKSKWMDRDERILMKLLGK